MAEAAVFTGVNKVAVKRLTKDLRIAAETMSDDEARFIVDSYYIWQEDRKRSFNQIRALGESSEPNSVIQWLAGNAEALEGQLKASLDKYSASKPVGRWARSITGIGPVIAAGLLAHVDIAKAPTAGHIWRYAGLDPTVRWEKGRKRPWNATLKTLCWKIGESFVKVQNNEDDVYGHVYAERKAQEWQRNARGEYAEQATAKLASVKIGKDTSAYQWYAGRYSGVEFTGDEIVPIPAIDGRAPQPMLPPAHIHARAKRYAVKLFLSHYQAVAWESTYGEKPPKPYIIEHGGHAHYIAPPNWPLAD